VVGKLGIDATIKDRYRKSDLELSYPKHWDEVGLAVYLWPKKVRSLGARGLGHHGLARGQLLSWIGPCARRATRAGEMATIEGGEHLPPVWANVLTNNTPQPSRNKRRQRER
jgi:hypothetical protein